MQLLTLLALLLLLPPPLAVLQDEIGEMKAAEAQREKLVAEAWGSPGPTWGGGWAVWGGAGGGWQWQGV